MAITLFELTLKLFDNSVLCIYICVLDVAHEVCRPGLHNRVVIKEQRLILTQENLWVMAA